MMSKVLLWIPILAMFVDSYGFSQTVNYPQSVENKTILTGTTGSWDEESVHTFSVVEVNKNGYKYFAYYGLDHYNDKEALVKKCGLAMSNDLENWVKYQQNPVINFNCRWPTVVYDGKWFYMFYAEYNKSGDSRIVMRNSQNGMQFGEKSIVVPYSNGEQNQNPFIYFNQADSNYYLFYYNGTERAEINPRWNILIKKSFSLIGLATAKPNTLLSSDKTMAAPSVAFYNGKYFLLVEEFENFNTMEKWVTNAFWSDSIDRGYQRVNNNSVLAKNDACAFQYLINGKLYVFYSHSTNAENNNWNIKMIKLK
jgi:hypothetical protein